jgi:hypothetical protein
MCSGAGVHAWCLFLLPFFSFSSRPLNAARPVTFSHHQKDAYSNSAGRNLPGTVWPPHTTTSVDIQCAGQPRQTIEQTNHGTSITKVDANGKFFLTLMKNVTVLASAQRTNELVAAMATCKCDGKTNFLTMDSLKGDSVRSAQMLATLGTIVAKELTCPPGLKEQVLAFLAGPRGDAQSAQLLMQVSSQCLWSDGRPWARGVENALARALGADRGSYHVCNNDAQLQTSLFSLFAAGRRLVCDNTRAMCAGPRFFYNP